MILLGTRGYWQQLGAVTYNDSYCSWYFMRIIIIFYCISLRSKLVVLHWIGLQACFFFMIRNVATDEMICVMVPLHLQFDVSEAISPLPRPSHSVQYPE